MKPVRGCVTKTLIQDILTLTGISLDILLIATGHRGGISSVIVVNPPAAVALVVVVQVWPVMNRTLTGLIGRGGCSSRSGG